MVTTDKGKKNTHPEECSILVINGVPRYNHINPVIPTTMSKRLQMFAEKKPYNTKMPNIAVKISPKTISPSCPFLFILISSQELEESEGFMPFGSLLDAWIE